MTRRDVTQRYRGSAGDVLRTVLHPVLLMATYFFVFGIVLQSRFKVRPEPNCVGLLFLAGMLPWLGMSEAIGRAPNGILENRVLVKKVVFPGRDSAGHTSHFRSRDASLRDRRIRRGSARSPPTRAGDGPVVAGADHPATSFHAWVRMVPVRNRRLPSRYPAKMIGFFLTLWFFLTPICYPETALPPGAAAILTKNPVYVLVRSYRAILLDGHAPPLAALGKLWLVAAVVFIGGHAWFYKLRR